jgi:prephenate dehydrogenase
MLINKIAIIGVGLIGGSLARALKSANACKTVSGFGRNQDNLKVAVELGVIDDYSENINDVIRDANIIVIATPLSSYPDMLQSIAGNTDPDAIITDVGSVKGSVVTEARSALGEGVGSFVPGHPIAGTEQSGVKAAFAELFQDHLVILTPLEENKQDDVEMISQMWKLCGASVVELPVDYHDQVLAATSHLPHVLAYALVDTLASMSEQDDIFRFSAGGFRDFTRIASSHPGMWTDICLANELNLLDMIEEFKIHLDEIAELLNKQDKQGLQQLFNKVKVTRDKHVLPNKKNPAENNPK